MKLISAIAFVATLGLASATLSADLGPLLEALLPALLGLDAGLHHGANNVNLAIRDVGATAQQGANAVADVAGYTTAGLGTTVGKVPAAVEKTARAIDHSPGAIGAVDHTVFGAPKHSH